MPLFILRPSFFRNCDFLFFFFLFLFFFCWGGGGGCGWTDKPSRHSTITGLSTLVHYAALIYFNVIYYSGA